MGEEDSLGEDDINIQLGIFVPSQNVEKAREPKASERDGPRQSVDSDKDGSSKESSRKPGEKRKRSESMSSPPSDPGDEEEPTRNGVEENNNTSSGETLLMNEKRKRKKRSKKKRKQTHTGSITVTESVKDQAETALEYLEMWESGGGSSEWTFKKKTQLWLLHNTYDKKKIPKTKFKILLRYLEPLKGNQRQLAIDRAHDILTHNKDCSSSKSSRMMGKRARAVLKALS